MYYSNIPIWLGNRLTESGFRKIDINLVEKSVDEYSDMEGNIILFSCSNISNHTQAGNTLDNLYANLEKFKVKKIIYLSNYGVYSPKYQNSYSENDRLDALTFNGSINLLFENALHFISKKNVNVVVLRVFNLYGPGQTEPYVLSEFINKIRKNQMVKAGDIKKTRDFVFIDDFLEVIKIIIERKLSENYNIYNVGSGKPTTIKELIRLIERITNKKAEISFSPEYIREEYDYDYVVADIKKMQTEMRWTPKTDIETGIKLTYEWLSGRDQL